jgi:hypothetical protein
LFPWRPIFFHEKLNNTYRILNSSVIKFVVGEGADGEATDFLVHKEAMAQLSEPFRDMLNEESSSESITWRSVTKKSLERLAQFAYTGDYTVPKPLGRRGAVDGQEAVENDASRDILDGGLAVEEDSAPVPEDIPAEEEPPMPKVEYSDYVGPEGRGWWGAVKIAPRDPSPEPDPIAADPADGWGTASWSQGPPTYRKKSKKKGIPAPEIVEEEPQPEPVPEPIGFPSLSFDLVAPRDNHKDGCEPSEQFDPKGNYSNVFRSHAGLWILANSYKIDSLTALSLYKLHKTLRVFEINDQNVSDLVDLVRYVYNPKLDVLEDESLRKLVAQYMAWESVTLARDSNFMALLREGGPFVEDLFKIVMQRF